MLQQWMILAVFLLSVLLVGVYRQLALARGWVDIPNHRSSHVRATPRGAGVIFALLIAAAVWSGVILGSVPAALGGAVCTGLVIALIGWWDDVNSVSAARRFFLYWLVSLAALTFLYFDTVATDGNWSPLVLVVLLVSSVALQWLINLYNFMDGINGIAAVEAIFVLCAMLLLGAQGAGLPWLLGCGLAAVCGFLLWNFPVARVFMGDAGSAFLGFLLGLAIIWSGFSDRVEPIVWLILLGVFVVDATYTLVVRMATGQAWRQGHRLHAYQVMARRLGSHARVVGLISLINIAWLLPWALLVKLHWVGAGWALLASYMPLALVCRAIGAGNPSRTQV